MQCVGIGNYWATRIFIQTRWISWKRYSIKLAISYMSGSGALEIAGGRTRMMRADAEWLAHSGTETEKIAPAHRIGAEPEKMAPSHRFWVQMEDITPDHRMQETRRG